MEALLQVSNIELHGIIFHADCTPVLLEFPYQLISLLHELLRLITP